MRFKKYINSWYVVIQDDVSDPINEVTAMATGDIAIRYTVPKINKEKKKKLNPKTNRMKFSRKTKFFKTNIKPEDRSFKNLPRYKGTKKPICRFQDWLEIKTDDDFKKKGASGGKSSNGKYYGYSHRAVFGFKRGYVVKNDDHIGRDRKRKTPYTIKNDNDAKWHAIRFSREVS